MKNIGGVNYLTIGETAKLVDRSAQTIKSWFRWCQTEDIAPEQKGLPSFRRDLDAKGTYHFKEDDIAKLIEFRDNISYGQMSDFNSSRWGKRGKDIEARKQEIEDAAENETSASLENATPAFN